MLFVHFWVIIHQVFDENGIVKKKIWPGISVRIHCPD
jgi:hypothetical protein